MDYKKITSAALIAAMLATSVAVSTGAKEIGVVLDEQTVECPVPARIENGRTMIPMRAIFEAFGMTVTWNDAEKSVTAQNEKDVIQMTVGKKTLHINDKELEIEIAPYITEGTTMVPVRAVAESLDAEVVWNNDEQRVEITSAEYAKNKDEWKENIGSIDLSTLSVEGEGIKTEGKVVMITDGGDFTVTGENTDAMIWVNTGEKVKLRLSGMNLTNSDGPAIFFERVGKALITVAKGTENVVCDGEEYTTDAKAAIFSEGDIEIKGEGVLKVTSKAHHAVASDDDIKIEEGTLVLTSEKKDGIHANNTIKIKGGSINITAYGDGIQSEEDVVIENGEINIETTGPVAENSFGMDPMGGFGGFGGRGDRGDKRQNGGFDRADEKGSETDNAAGKMQKTDRPKNMTMPEEMGGMTPPEGMDGMTPPERMGDMKPPEGIEGMTPPEGMGDMKPPEGMENMTTNDSTNDTTTSTKGIKAETSIEICGGKIVVNSSDHAIHSAGTIEICGGEMTLESKSGKGISAHGDLVVDDGASITVTKATEGIESKGNMTINGGKISVTCSDDGLNTGGTGGRDVVSRQNADADTGHDMTINGGEIFVNAAGDGLDSNGKLIVNGGSIVVEGSTNNGNGALDSGGVIKVNGGEIIALGASGMAEAPDNDSKQAAFKLVTDEIPAGSTIVIKNAKGKEIYSYKTVKKGNSIVYSSDKIKVGEKYTVEAGQNVYEIEMTQNVTVSGTQNMGFGGMRGPWH